jgi:hypothetical protein
MKSFLFSFGLTCALVIPSLSFAQNVGIGTATPLERLHVAGGLRVNNLAGVGVRMVGTDANGTLTIIAAGTTGQVLTQTAGGPAFASPSDWALLGNGGTNAGTHFVGTTDNVDLVVRTNNTEGMRITNAQRVGIGTTTPVVKVEVNSGASDALFAHSANVGGYLGYETNFTFGVSPQTINGAGVWASNPAAGYTSMYAQSSGSATVSALITYSNVWMASYNYVDNAIAGNNPSVSYSQLNNTNTSTGGYQIATRGYNNRATTTGNPGWSVGVQGLSNSQFQDSYGVQGLTFCNATYSVGGYFSGNNYAGTNFAYAYVGGTTDGVTARKIIGTGTVSEVIPTPNHGRVTLTAPESPEYWYQDYGSANMVNGFVHVDLDPILTEIIIVDADNPLSVFVTPVNMPNFNGITVMNESATGFDLVELNGGQHSGKLRYQLICKPKTNFGEGRFPQAPGPGFIKKELEPLAAKAANQPTKAFRWPSDHEQYNYDPADYMGPGDFVPAGPHKGKFKMADGVYVDQLPATKPQ